jgi:hypothetical protein
MAFCEVLVRLAKLDPQSKNCMTKEIERSNWVFEFNRVTFFITTFAPFYPITNSRYAFDAHDCFILFQPELSFAMHDLCQETSETNYENPKNSRDKIRLAFKNAGREYLIRETIRFPMCHDMIKPLDENEPVINWWQYKDLFL